MRLKDKTAIVTGAGSGFGKGIALRFAEEGAKVGVIDVNEESAFEVAAEIGDTAFAFKADVSLDQNVSSMFQQALNRLDKLDILVNNAGTTHRNQPMTEVTEEEYDQIFAVNVKSVFLTAKYVVPIMKKGGRGDPECCFNGRSSTSTRLGMVQYFKRRSDFSNQSYGY